ncbi:TetR/AcrR family transcriptional regulator [Corynebacterium hylobatis]|uniref:TetR/AcrR family transcriptional regulator n=1 Tax=Corynebacterium hylobatis TaxID=1859290 RepID=A0A3R9ZIQ6_9CORY|nr:TetR/AcrR family transcriptional regulator [Corynebacterium hylobatis]RSZ63168.1 TetR/AcrR family transcriptional regulator [Corynebacterium hylobatis]
MSSQESPAKATRRRGAELDEAIRQAVRDELEAHGYAALTFEGVARRAQTSKPVIYRRYESRALMVVDAWIRPTPSDPEPTSTGDLREDFRLLARAVFERFSRIGIETLRGILAELPPEQIPKLTETTTSWARDALHVVLAAARERGEIGSRPLPEHVAELPIVLMRNELFFTGRPDTAPLRDREIDRIIDDICLPLLRPGDGNGS